MSKAIWEMLPEKYRASEDPDEVISLWRGDFRGYENQGMRCRLLDGSIDPEQVVYDSLFVKYPSIRTLVARHTHSNHNSPFVSLTDDIEIARSFNSGAIYRVEIPAARLVVDPPKGECSKHEEALAIGMVLPCEIVDVFRTKPSVGML